jgi:hypothetical protein
MSFAFFSLRAALPLAAVLVCWSAAVAAPMTFRTMPVGDRCGARCPQVIIADGEITNRTPDDFVAFVRRQAQKPNARGVILLNSQGGRVAASMQLGKLFRTAGAAVIVARAGPRGMAPGRCYSACVYALMGASKRVIPNASKVGIHRMFAYGLGGASPEDTSRYERVYATPDLVQRLSDYAGLMGVSREIVHTAERVTPDQLRIVTPQEIRRWRLGSEKF